MKSRAVVAVLIGGIILLGSCGRAVQPVQAPAPLSISPASAPSGTVGFAYNLALNAAGGQAPYSWSVISGTIPAGLTLDASSGVLSGVPTATGTSNFTVQAMDSSMPARTGSMPFTLAVNGQLAFSITSLPDAAVNVPYSATASVSGGNPPYTWSVVSGGLPPGLSLNGATGVISGTPTTAGGYGLGLKVTDSSNPQQTAKFFSGINVDPQLTITSTSLPDGVVGTSYSATLTATGGTGSYTWSISSGSLPDGISLDPSTGNLSGTPTTSGQANFVVQVTDTANPPQDPTLPLSINVIAQGANDRLMKGSYAFLLQGFDSGGAVAFAGIMEADGAGSITSGLLDINRSSGPQHNIVIESGKFAIDSGNRGTITIRSVLGAQTFRVAVNRDGSLAHFIEFDSTGPNLIRGNGIMKRRDTGGPPQSGWNGDYAFAFSGSTSMGQRSAMLGSFAASNQGAITAGLADSDSDGIVVEAATVHDASSYSFAATGRGELKLAADGLGSVTGAVYSVSTNESFFVRTDSQGSDLLSGEIMQQSGSPFSASTFGGSTVLHVEGESSNGSTTVGVGLISLADSNSLVGTYDVNEGREASSQTVAAGSYTLASTEFGRGTMKFASNDFVFYLVDSTRAFVMDSAGRAVKTGMWESQSVSDAVLSEPVGSFAAGSEADTSAKVAFVSGMLTVAPAGDLAGTADVNLPGNVLSSGQTQDSGVTAIAQGRLRTADGKTFYVISPTRMIEADMQSGAAAPRLVILDQ